MKITAFLLLIFCMQVSATTLAQNVSLSEHNASLEKVINDIKQQTGYSFFYNQDWLLKSKPVDISVQNVSLDEALKICFADQPYDYAIVNKTIVLKPKESRPAVSKEASVPINVSGKVTDTAGTALIGATVSIKDSKNSTITNENGEFSISAQPGDLLAITYIGYKPWEIRIRESTPYLNVSLHQEVGGLKEVVINTGYQDIPAERATGSFAQVNNELFNRKTSPDVLSRLEGIVPGLLVNRNVNVSNNPNGIDISIHGYNTLFSNSQPLIVVDNFPYDGNIQNINPNDVESVSILKDAAAASIWGVQAGNGVIVITTKKGRRDQPLKVGVNANVIIGNKPNLFYNPNFLDSKDFISVEESLFNQGYYDDALSDTRNHPVVSPVVQLLGNERAGTISASDANAQISSFENYDVRNDLNKYFFQKSVQQQYAINFSGGGKGNSYYYSIGYDNDLSNYVGNHNDRLTISAQNNFYLYKNFQITSQINYVQSNATNNSQAANVNVGGGYNNIYPYAQLADSHGTPLAIPRDYNYSWITDPTAQAGLLDWQYRPLEEQQIADNTSVTTDARIVTSLKYSLPFGLSAELRHQYERSENKAQNYYSQDSYYARNLINEFTNLSGNPENPIPIGGMLNESNTITTANHVRAQLNFDKNWNQNNIVTATAGAEVDQNIENLDGPPWTYGYDKTTGTASAVDFVDYFLQNPSQQRRQIPGGTGGTTQFTDRYVSYFSIASYTYKNKYTFSASGRIDASNLFGVNTNQKEVPLYHVGGKWDVDKENFYRFDWLPKLSLRATYGYEGNLNKIATAVTTLQQLSGSYYLGLPYASVASSGNPDLRWEKDRLINFGVDFGTKNNILTGAIEYYLKKGTDLFGQSPLPPSTGISQFFGNTASIAGKGFEFSLTLQAIHSDNFRWTSAFQFNYNLDKVTKYDVPQPVGRFVTATADGDNISPIAGKPIFAIYSYKTGPLSHNTGDPQGYLNGELSTNYTSIINNATVDSLKYNGPARPTTYGSFRNTFSYKALSVSANIIYKLNYYFRRSSINYAGLFEYWNGNSDFAKRWQQPGDELHTSVPSMPLVANADPYRDQLYTYSEGLVDKGDHIRLQDVTLNYNFKKPKIFHNAFSDINVYSNINNVGIIWRANKDHLDPDIFTGGTFVYPTPRTISFGVSANF